MSESQIPKADYEKALVAVYAKFDESKVTRDNGKFSAASEDSSILDPKKSLFEAWKNKLFGPKKSGAARARAVKEHAYAVSQHEKMAEHHASEGNHGYADAHKKIAESHKSASKHLESN